MRVLIADDQNMLLELFSAVLGRDGIETTLTLDLHGALDAVASSEPFDLILLDYNMPGMDGLEGLKSALSNGKGAPVALMSGNLPQHTIREAISLGAVGFLPKATPSQKYVTSIRRLASGQPLDDKAEAVAPQLGTTCDAPGDEPRLTAREMRVLQYLAHGKTLDEIGSELGLRDLTLDFVIKTLCRKFAANDAAAALTNAKRARVV